MSASTNTLKLLIGNHLLRNDSWSKPTDIYLALFTTLPADDGTGGVEVTGGSYARVDVGPDDAMWNTPSGDDGIFSNLNTVSFPGPTANWGNVIGAGLFDASSGGTLLARANLDSARNILSGDPTPNFPAGSLKFIFA